MQKRAFSGAGFAHQGQLFARGDFEVEACEHDQNAIAGAIVFGQAYGADRSPFPC